MSNSSPSPPPLPPPTVPSQNPIMQPAPPQPKHPPTTPSPNLSAALANSSSPSNNSSPSSDSHSSTVPMHEQRDENQQPDDNYVKKHPRRTCCCHFRFRPTPHHIHEPARSLWFDTRILLVFRLVVTAMLIGHLIFFSLRGDFSYRLYSTWNFVGLSVAFLLVVISSLLDVLRDEDSHDDNGIGATGTEGMVTDAERQPVGSPPLPDPKLARALTRLTVPLYLIFVTATLFGTIVYWAAIHDFSVVSISYPLMILKAFAPAAALLDFVLSLRMRFRFLYVLIYILYNGIYVGALVLFDKLQEDPVYSLFDPNIQSSKDFTAKSAGVGAASVVAGLLMYAFSYLPELPYCIPKNERVKKKQGFEDGSDISPTSASDVTSDSSGTKPLDNTDRDQKNADSGILSNASRKEEGRGKHNRSFQTTDRLSLPISGSGSITQSTSAKWLRSSSAKLAASRSGSSIGSEGRPNSLVRSDSAWEAMNQPSARRENEYFAMPAVSPEREVIQLKPLPRNESASSTPGLLSRSGSGRMSRSGSRRWSHSGSRNMTG